MLQLHNSCMVMAEQSNIMLVRVQVCSTAHPKAESRLRMHSLERLLRACLQEQRRGARSPPAHRVTWPHLCGATWYFGPQSHGRAAVDAGRLRPHSYRSVSPGALPTFLMALCTCPCRWLAAHDRQPALLETRSRFFAHVAALARCRVGQSDPGAWKCAL